jgi:PST family polysaccharide transporter
MPEVLRGVVRGAVSISLAATGFGAVSLIIGMLAGSAARTIIQWRLVPFRPNLSFDRGIARTMISYGVGASLLQIITVVSQNTDTAAVGRVLGGAALGLYTIGYRIPELIIANVGQFVSVVAFPALARKRAEDAAGLARASLNLLRYQALYSIPVAVGLAIVSPPLIVVFFGDKWQEAGGVMSAIAILQGIATLIYPLGDVFKALAKQRILVALNCVQLPLLIAAVILAAPSGILAVAWARVGGMVLFAALFLGQVKRVIDVDFGELLVAIRPGALTALGVGIGAGAVRLAWPALSVGPLLAATAAGAIGGALVLRWAAPAVFESVVSQLEGLRSRRAPAGARP